MPTSHTALVLCGGRGTRLQEVISDRPKFLAPVAGRPYADHLLQFLRGYVRDVVLCTGYLADQIEEYCGDGTRWGLHIRYSTEPDALGTAGAVKHAVAEDVTDPFWVINGDSFVNADLGKVSDLYQRRGAEAVIVVVEVPDASRYGRIILGPEEAVLAFGEKASSGAGHVNAGIYLLSPTVLNHVEPGRAASMEHDVLPRIVGNGLYGWISPGPFVDIGTEESFEYAQHLLADWPNTSIPRDSSSV
jgi:NDP-sugar pyrophosphorylase family protein